jgi:hypothetical protein
MNDPGLSWSQQASVDLCRVGCYGSGSGSNTLSYMCCHMIRWGGERPLVVTARQCGSVHMHVDVVGGSEAETLSHSHRQSLHEGKGM